jgi:hypothetical protein
MMDVGVNVYNVTGGGNVESVVSKAIESWYSYQKQYNWKQPMLSGKYAGLFTQVVWKESKSLGLGVATRGDLTIVVCLYKEQGNVASDQSHKENVQEPSN